jgi:hypothetical protein
MWQEGREGEERLMSATGKLELGSVTWRPEEGHLAPEVKTANEIMWDYVWDKLYSPSISATCSKWYIRKVPFVLWAQSLDSLLSHCQLA